MSKIELPQAAFVKGGTSSAAWDRQKQAQYRRSDENRSKLDQQREAVRWSANRADTKSGLLSLQLSGSNNPKVCLTYKAKDSALDQHCICEVTMLGPAEMMLLLVCPKCLERTARMDDSQIMIRSSHRPFWLDVTKRGMWLDPLTGQSVMLAGTITGKDKMSCDAQGCDWQFRIDNSELYGSHHYSL